MKIPHHEARLHTRYGEPVMLEGVRVSGDLRGLLFEASVEQRFSNPGDQGVEIVYTFPLPWAAVLLGVDVRLGDRDLTGAVVEKRDAEARYEEALSDGDAAIMLERNADHSYTLNLGNLMAKETCVVTVRYARTLQFEQRGLRLLIPTVIAPRYGDPVRDGGLQPHQAPVHDLFVDYPFDLELRLHGDLVQSRVASPSHPVAMAFAGAESDKVLTVSLARRGALDRDFVLVVDRLAHGDVGLLARDRVDPEGLVALVSFCPCIPAEGPGNVTVKVLVDCSGSMAGDSIDASRRALQDIVRQMRQGDRFSLSRFGSVIEHRARGMWSVTDATRVAAQRWIGELDANLSGTEMAAALESTFAIGRNEPADVLIVTDGEISAIDSTLETARASGHRLFVVGIGSSPAEIHLRRLADATGGACDFVAPGEAVEPAVLRMFARLRSPRLTGLAIDWPDDIRPAWMAPLPTAVFDGDTVNVFAWLPAMPRGEVRLLGTRNKSAAPQAIGCVRFDPSVEASDTLSRMAASERLRSLPDEATREKSAESVRLALAYELVTEHTNFLLVHARAVGEKATDMPDLRTVAQMVPAGWGGIGTAALAGRGANVGMPRMSAPLDAGPPLAPVVRYQRRALHATVAMPDDCFDSLDIPTFLRRMPIDAVPSSPMQPSMDRIDPSIVREPRAVDDPTPAALHRWLVTTTTMVWPRTYLELRRANLAPEVVDWLEYGIAGGQGGLSEQAIVTTFVYVMSQWEFFDDSSRTPDLTRAVVSMVSNIAVVPERVRSNIDLQLLEEVVAILWSMSEEQWPLRIAGSTSDHTDHDRLTHVIGALE